ncbi:MAG: VWA domain-containing protein [Bacteroidota bacterium]
MIKDYFSNITFDWPWMFALLAALPFLAIYYFRSEKRKTPTFLVPSVQRIGSTGNWKTMLRNSPVIFRLLALALLITALAKPATYRNIELTEGEGIDIVLCLDVSGSMLARDFTPDRLQASVNVARNFINNRKGDRIGLVIFAGQSLTLCPLTTDRKVVVQQLNTIEYGNLADGTAIGSGLASAVDRLRNGDAKSQVVILLTDGENTGGLIDPPTAKELAKTYGIKVYTIGVGTVGYAPMPYKTAGGTTVMQQEKVSIDEPLLTEIANETGGHYYRATNTKSLDSVYASIDMLEKSKVETTIFEKRTDEFFPLIIAAILLLLLEALLRYTVFRKFP